MSDQNTFSPEKDGRIPAIQDDTGAYFIDGCPKYFGIILNFLRRGVLEKGANVDLKFLRNEAEYFCIEGLVKVIDEEIEKTEKEEASKSLNQFSNLENELRVIQGEIRTQGQRTRGQNSELYEKVLKRIVQKMSNDFTHHQLSEKDKTLLIELLRQLN